MSKYFASAEEEKYFDMLVALGIDNPDAISVVDIGKIAASPVKDGFVKEWVEYHYSLYGE